MNRIEQDGTYTKVTKRNKLRIVPIMCGQCYLYCLVWWAWGMNLLVALPLFLDCITSNLFNEPKEPLPNNGEWRTDTYFFVADAMYCGCLAGARRAHDLAGDVDDLREARPREVGVMGLCRCQLHNTGSR